MIIFSLLLLMSSLFCENNPIDNFKKEGFIIDCEMAEPIYFDQYSLKNIQWYIRSSGVKVFRQTLDNPRPLDKLNKIFEAFIEYGNERGFNTKTRLGKIERVSFFSDLSKQKPDLKGKEQKTLDTTSFILDPEIFDLPKTVSLTVTLDEKTQTIHKSPALETLVKQIVDKKLAQDYDKANFLEKRICFLKEEEKRVLVLAATVIAVIGVSGALYLQGHK